MENEKESHSVDEPYDLLDFKQNRESCITTAIFRERNWAQRALKGSEGGNNAKFTCIHTLYYPLQTCGSDLFRMLGTLRLIDTPR